MATSRRVSEQSERIRPAALGATLALTVLKEDHGIASHHLSQS
jgi:hypothetical protein